MFVENSMSLLAKCSLALAGLLLSACVLPNPSSTFHVTVSEPRLLPAMNAVIVSVTMANTGRRPSERVTVACTYFDAAGAPVQTGLIYFSNVPPGDSDTEAQMIMSPNVNRGDCGVR
jgi:hypothetical protein